MLVKKIEIKSTPHCTGIFVDGQHIQGVRKFEISQEVGQEIPIVTLELVAYEVDIKCVAELKEKNVCE